MGLISRIFFVVLQLSAIVIVTPQQNPVFPGWYADPEVMKPF